MYFGSLSEGEYGKGGLEGLWIKKSKIVDIEWKAKIKYEKKTSRDGKSSDKKNNWMERKCDTSLHNRDWPREKEHSHIRIHSFYIILSSCLLLAFLFFWDPFGCVFFSRAFFTSTQKKGIFLSSNRFLLHFGSCSFPLNPYFPFFCVQKVDKLRDWETFMNVTVAFAVKEGWMQQHREQKIIVWGFFWKKKINAKNGRRKMRAIFILVDGGANNTKKNYIPKKGKCCWFLYIFFVAPSWQQSSSQKKKRRKIGAMLKH